MEQYQVAGSDSSGQVTVMQIPQLVASGGQAVQNQQQVSLPPSQYAGDGLRLLSLCQLWIIYMEN